MDTTSSRKPASVGTDQKKPLTQEQKIQRQLVAKIKRLNLKLSKVKAVAVEMNDKSGKAKDFSSRQVEKWSKDILNTINKPEGF